MIKARVTVTLKIRCSANDPQRQRLRMIKSRVTLKNGFDPQGKALGALGFEGIDSVRQGKVFDLSLEGDDAKSAEKSISEMCEKLLANTVIENYSVEIL